MSEFLLRASELAVGGLWRAVWQGGLFVLAVLAITRVAKMTAGARATAWWLANVKLVLTAAVPLALAMPLLPPPAHVEPVHSRLESGAPLFGPGPLMIATRPAAPRPPPFPWMGLLCTVWLVGAAGAVERLVAQHRRARQLTADALPLSDPGILDTVQRLALDAGLSHVPQVRSSDAVLSPLVTGLWNPVILLPTARLEQLRGEAMEMALAHEVAHVARRDLWAAWVPALGKVLLWFFPGAYLAAREHAQAREEACDALALALTGASPAGYGRLLLALGVAQDARTTNAACGASPHFQHLKRRLTMLNSVHSISGSRWWVAALPMALLALTPLRVSAREASPPTGSASRSGIRRSLLDEPADPSDWSYIYIHGNDARMSGTIDDLRRVKALAAKLGVERLLWVRSHGHEYTLSDPALMDRIEAMSAREKPLSDRESAVSEREERVSGHESELSDHDRALAEDESRLAEQEVRLADEATHTSSDDRRIDLEHQRAELEHQRQELAHRRSELSRQRAELSHQRREMSGQRRAVSRERSQLDRDNDLELRALLEEAIASGRARPVQ